MASVEEVNEVMSKYFELQNQLSEIEKEEDRKKLIMDEEEKFKKATKFIIHLIKNDQYSINYQPQVKGEKQWASAESLFRMEYNGKKIYPDVVFSLLREFGEEYNLTERDLTLKLFDLVCEHTYAMKQEMGDGFYVSYNVNPKLIDREFCNQLLSIAKEHNLSPQSIGIELLEVSSFDDINLEDIKFLKEQGFKILLDDLGTGYATEEVMKKIPFDVIKFSAKVIEGISQSKDQQKQVKEVVDFCKSHNISTIAEHVSNEEDYNMVKQLGVDKVQGWYFEKDMPYETFMQKCMEHRK